MAYVGMTHLTPQCNYNVLNSPRNKHSSNLIPTRRLLNPTQNRRLSLINDKVAQPRIRFRRQWHRRRGVDNSFHALFPCKLHIMQHNLHRQLELEKRNTHIIVNQIPNYHLAIRTWVEHDAVLAGLRLHYDDGDSCFLAF